MLITINVLQNKNQDNWKKSIEIQDITSMKKEIDKLFPSGLFDFKEVFTKKFIAYV